jgi:hypothetical protein
MPDIAVIEECLGREAYQAAMDVLEVLQHSKITQAGLVTIARGFEKLVANGIIVFASRCGSRS